MNVFSKGVLIASLVAVVAYMLFKKNDHFTLMIGILSARSHFDQRDFLRKNLNEVLKRHNVDFKFIVAENACPILPKLRVNEFSCVTTADLSRTQHTEYLHKFPYHLTNLNPLRISSIQGVDFTLLQDIFVTHLGIYDKDQDGIASNSKVLIYDKHSQESAVGVLFLPFSQGTVFENFRFKKCSSHFLPKGFQGTLVVEGFDKDTLFFVPKCRNYLKSDILKIENGLRYGNHPGEFPANFISHTSGCFYGASMNFTVKNYTKDVSNEQTLYTEELEQEKTRLSLEMETHNDIYLAPTTTEVYRNLPLKMLQFYQYVAKLSYDFLLKTDDDCYVNISGIMAFLDGISLFSLSDIWIGNFRVNFAIDKQGKWAEHNYPAVSYPPFACGSGYILSKNIVDWIGANAKHLKLFQGEDTSLGIWLAALNVNRIHEERFHCSKTCGEEAFSIPENTLEELQNLYLNGSCILSNNDI